MSRNTFLNGLKLAAAGMIFLLIAGWMQNIHPAFDSPSHFRLHLVSALVVTGLVLLVFRCWVWAMAGLLVAAISIGLTLPYLPGSGGINAQAALVENIDDDPANILRVVQANVRYNNAETHKASKIIAAAKPDIILLQEITRISEGILTDFEDSHPHQVFCHRQGVGSVAILSRFPLGNPNRRQCLWRLGFARADFVINGKPVAFASFHSRWPWPFSQPRQLQALRPEFEQLGHPVILAGDFNATPWSAAVQQTAEITGSKIASGLHFTWGSPATQLRQLMGPVLPIDQIMISPELSYLSRRVLPDSGSDHYPVLTRIRLR